VQRHLVTPAGIDERGDHRMLGAAGLEAAVELGLPPVQGRASGRSGRSPAPRAVDDLVRAADEAVQGVDGGSDVARQELRRAPVGRVVASLQAPARPIGLSQPNIAVDAHAHSPVRGTRTAEMTALVARQLPTDRADVGVRWDAVQASPYAPAAVAAAWAASRSGAQGVLARSSPDGVIAVTNRARAARIR
jgi:hypothetical protein